MTCSKLQHVYINGIDALLRNVCVPQLVFLFQLQKSVAHKSCVYRRWREAHGAVAFHGLGESQAVPAAVQAS